MKNIIVHCPTKELWNKVQWKMFETSEWAYGGKKYLDEFYFNGPESCISILEDSTWEMLYSSRKDYQKEYPRVPIISAEEYLDTENDNRAVRGSNSDFGKAGCSIKKCNVCGQPKIAHLDESGKEIMSWCACGLFFSYKNLPKIKKNLPKNKLNL